MTPSVLGIFGPTASGKSALAEALSDRVPAEIVSADSAQVYRGLPILTNQPATPTHLVAIWELEHEASVAEYQRLAHRAVDAALGRGHRVLVAGGTGLYMRAALAELELPGPPPPGARQRWEKEYDRLGPEGTHALLARSDPRTAERIHANDRRRVVRALELVESGQSLRPRNDRLWSAHVRHPTIVVGLEVPRAELERRIERRARAMFAAGVQEEVRRACERTLSTTARKILGLREVAELSPAEALAVLVLRTRQLASYQRKWMRRIPGLVSVAADRPPGEIADDILELASGGQQVPRN